MDTQDSPYIAGHWSHLFLEDGRQVERETRIVFSVADRKLAHMEVRRSHRWERASTIEMDDLADSLTNANPEALKNPSDWDLEFTSTLPDWAVAPAQA